MFTNRVKFYITVLQRQRCCTSHLILILPPEDSPSHPLTGSSPVSPIVGFSVTDGKCPQSLSWLLILIGQSSPPSRSYAVKLSASQMQTIDSGCDTYYQLKKNRLHNSHPLCSGRREWMAAQLYLTLAESLLTHCMQQIGNESWTHTYLVYQQIAICSTELYFNILLLNECF